MSKPTIVLASASPRRKTLLVEAGLVFEVEPADVDETLDEEAAEDPAGAAQMLAERKASRIALAWSHRPAWILGADTVVAIEVEGKPRLLGKPADEREARQMLETLSDTTHRVATGVCVIRAVDGERLLASEVTHVTMRAIRDEEIERYVASGEWRDRAGGYAIQETADNFVSKLSGGGFDNVVGLPVGLSLELLRSLGAPLEAGGSGG